MWCKRQRKLGYILTQFIQRLLARDDKIIVIIIIIITLLLTYLITYVLTYLLHGAESFLRS